MKPLLKKIGWGGAISIVLVLLFIRGLTSMKDNQKAVEKQEHAQPVKEPELTDADFVKHFSATWDSVEVATENGYPQYGIYCQELDKVIADLNLLISSDSLRLPETVNLRDKLSTSDKLIKAYASYAVYGNAYTDYDLRSPCESYLEQVVNDPDCLDVNGFKLLGKTNKGWKVAIRYRACNLFGAKILKTETFTVQYDLANKMFKVVSVSS